MAVLSVFHLSSEGSPDLSREADSCQYKGCILHTSTFFLLAIIWGGFEAMTTQSLQFLLWILLPYLATLTYSMR